ncbi:homoserine kinase [Chengkuizengella axinellae]|uniref:Homoserine kinase n=1 Tax=Chengkuizengella axinellae TaxID=3064388 RepID=A0ABT9IV68_9BACL|nr:homoserine kinase [Chengkuizengella sp. 2205SS18-9]MDP5272744.1 homoserine kinase [Chengkuizengella sp. 2205SS18-9]
MNSKTIRVKIPASTANLGPGFDTIGMALDLYTWIEMSFSDETKMKLFGDNLKGIPTDKSNLIYKVAQKVFHKAGVEQPNIEIRMYSDIPLTRGLGSSASAIVGALVAANALIEYPFSDNELFQMATSIENHPDNAGASLFGGIIVANWDGERAEYIRVEPNSHLEVLAVIPDFELATEKSRNVLPDQVLFKDAVFNVSHSSLLVAALCTGNLELIKHAMKDGLHQPHRASLIPGMNTILAQAVQHGALGAALSGAGPTLLALVHKNSNEKKGLEQFVMNQFKIENIKVKTLWLKPCLKGAQVVSDELSHPFHHQGTSFKGELKS